MAQHRLFPAGSPARLLAYATGLAAAAIAAICIALEVGPGTLASALLHLVTLAAAAASWLRADEASRDAERASSDVVSLDRRLARLDQRAVGSAGPALRSTVAEVTGTVGLLGGVVRELARNVAAQTRDMAHLRDTLSGASRGEEAPSSLASPEPLREPSSEPLSRFETPSRLQRSAPNEPEPDDRADTVSAEAVTPQPDPSLLPGRDTEDEIRRLRQVAEAFEADRVELHLQPVMALPQRKVRFYETLARLRLADGTLLPPDAFLPVLERLGRGLDFERHILARAVVVARHLAERGSEAIIGVNLSPRSVREPGFLRSLARTMADAPDIAGRIVLEISQDAWRSLDSSQKDTLTVLRDLGVPLSLDRASDLRFEARRLADLGVRFLKLPADLLIRAAEHEEGQEAGEAGPGVRDFASVLRREGIKLVAEKVEREEMVPALVALGVPLAQGFVFAAPRPVRAEVIGGAARRAG